MFLNFGTQCQFLLKFLLIWISLQHLCLLSWGGLAIWVIGHLHFCPALDTNRAAAVEMTGHLFWDDQTTEPSSSSLHFFIGISHLFFFFFPSLTVSVLKHPRPSSTALGMIDYQNSDHEQLIKRLRTAQSVDDVL